MPACFWTTDEATAEEQLHRPCGDRIAWDFMAMLFRSTWFERKWVIQEVALSQSAVVMWGNCRISWAWIGLAAAVLRTQRSNIVHNFNMNGVYNAYLMLRLSPHGDFPAINLSFLQLLRLTSGFKSTDPRDRIFALLGLHCRDHDPEISRFIDVDYSLSPQSLFVTVAEKLPNMQKNPLRFLINAEGHPEWPLEYEIPPTTAKTIMDTPLGHKLGPNALALVA
jgi:hypothetical protein